MQTTVKKKYIRVCFCCEWEKSHLKAHRWCIRHCCTRQVGSSSNTSDFYSELPWYESWPRYRICWPRYFMVLSRSLQANPGILPCRTPKLWYFRLWCNLIGWYKHFGGKYCFHFLDKGLLCDVIYTTTMWILRTVRSSMPNFVFLQYYHRKQCNQCHSVPREISICLLCGTVVCLKESCCKQSNVCEAVQVHTWCMIIVQMKPCSTLSEW
jgi:hypothetical protein